MVFFFGIISGSPFACHLQFNMADTHFALNVSTGWAWGLGSLPGRDGRERRHLLGVWMLVCWPRRSLARGPSRCPALSCWITAAISSLSLRPSQPRSASLSPRPTAGVYGKGAAIKGSHRRLGEYVTSRHERESCGPSALCGLASIVCL